MVHSQRDRAQSNRAAAAAALRILVVVVCFLFLFLLFGLASLHFSLRRHRSTSTGPAKPNDALNLILRGSNICIFN